jgi:hypothetical protein
MNKRPSHMHMEILAWDRYKNNASINRFMGSQPFSFKKNIYGPSLIYDQLAPKTTSPMPPV